jgi:hypothetical protein
VFVCVCVCACVRDTVAWMWVAGCGEEGMNKTTMAHRCTCSLFPLMVMLILLVLEAEEEVVVAVDEE